jgi:hypothetical protein
MPFIDEIDYTKIRRIRKPSLWSRFLWFIGDVLMNRLTVCEIVLLVAAVYLAVAVADAARSGRFGPGW